MAVASCVVFAVVENLMEYDSAVAVVFAAHLSHTKHESDFVDCTAAAAAVDTFAAVAASVLPHYFQDILGHAVGCNFCS